MDIVAAVQFKCRALEIRNTNSCLNCNADSQTCRKGLGIYVANSCMNCNADSSDMPQRSRDLLLAFIEELIIGEGCPSQNSAQ